MLKSFKDKILGHHIIITKDLGNVVGASPSPLEKKPTHVLGIVIRNNKRLHEVIGL